MTAASPFINEAARLAADAHRMLVIAVLSVEAAEMEFAPEAEAEVADLLELAYEFASGLSMAGDAPNRAAGIEPEDRRKLTTGIVTASRDAARVCGKLLRHGLDERFVAGLLSAWNLAYCKPPIPEGELQAIFHRVLDADTRRLEAARA